MRNSIFYFLVFLVLSPARAQSPYLGAYLVKDINSTWLSSPNSSQPSAFFAYGSRVVFSARTQQGAALVSTDGTESGTSVLAEGFTQDVRRFAVMGGKLIFNGTNGYGEELWSSDGTPAGTRLLADIGVGTGGSSPGDRIVYRGTLLFCADDRVNGRELWATDGTLAGTHLVKDLEPGARGAAPQSFVVFKGAVYFSAAGALWRSDGTADGTLVVNAGVDADNLVVVGEQLFFRGSASASSRQPWVSDGTGPGTHVVKDIRAGVEWIQSTGFVPFGNRVLFMGYDASQGAEPWISDGTEAGTQLVRDVNPGPASSMSNSIFMVVGATAYFAASTPATGLELWKTDGTEAGTMLVADIERGAASSWPTAFAGMGGRIYFAASPSGARGPNLWVSDGSAAGTHQVTVSGIPPVISTTSPDDYSTVSLTSIGGFLFFAAANHLNGTEPWKSDGTDAGTSMIANVYADGAPSGYPQGLTAAGDWVYFQAYDGIAPLSDPLHPPQSLWRSDGSEAGTIELGPAPGSLLNAMGHSAFFSRNASLWVTDGTLEGTLPAVPFTSRFPSAPKTVEFVLGTTALVNCCDGLWAADLTSTTPAARLTYAAGYSFVEVAGRAMYFVSPPDSPSRAALWITDGTPVGTAVVVPNLHGYVIRDERPAVAGGRVFFSVRGSSETDLWASDGTFEGTAVVKKGIAGSHLTAAGRNVFFVYDRALWVSDGTESGTRQLPATVYRTEMVAAGDRVVFAGDSAATGVEPWISDGTEEGTHLIRDIEPGTYGSGASYLTSADGQVYFIAVEALHGVEVWVTDGTSEGTTIAADVEPGPASGYPRFLVRAGQRLFFAATTEATGMELWALPLPAAPSVSIDDVRLREGDAGVTTARFKVALSPPASRRVTVDYSSSDNTARAGEDYDLRSGSLAFEPGETVKFIDVPVRGDSAIENNESFFMTLRNATGAGMARASAFAIIDDDDRTADLAISSDLKKPAGAGRTANVTNYGPATATGLSVLHTQTPSRYPTACAPCWYGDEMAASTTQRAFSYDAEVPQQYHTATVTAQQSDPQPANNTTAWTTAGNLSMDALYLTPGAQANIWVSYWGVSTTLKVESSDSSVVSAPVTLAVAAGPSDAAFAVRGLAVGSSSIRVSTSTAEVGTIKVDVRTPGENVRWPGAIEMYSDQSSVRLDASASYRIYAMATAPFTGKVATGIVTFSDGAKEIRRVSLDPRGGVQQVLVYLADVGRRTVTISYSGDVNFLPASSTFDIQVTQGQVTLSAAADRDGSRAVIHVRATGSSFAAPSGTITVTEPGKIAASQAVLSAAAGGTSQADLRLEGLAAGTHTLTITYSGDSRYQPGTQNLRIADQRRRAVHR